jgi:hypothetical protein
VRRLSKICNSPLASLIVGFLVLGGFSGMDSPGVMFDGGPAGPHTRGLMEEIYGPFDTLRTDIGDYIWPTNASTVITSSFADYRRSHLHEGIDISTNNQSGYPVYASRSGYVSRIFISRRGYGKMLLVRHKDGFVTYYAHLQRFRDSIETFAKRVQKQTRRYSMEVDLDSTLFPVSKGDLIAYTGATGIGSAHLHFEVRDSSFNPINPFLLPQISSAISDEVPPRFVMVAFTPLVKSARVQGRSRVWIVDAEKENSASYALPDPVKLLGVVGISVCVTDQSDVLKYKTSVYRLEAFIDGKVIFTSAKNFIPEDETGQVSLYYDKSLLRVRRGRFEKLYVEDGNRLPFYNRSPKGTGLIDTSELEPGEHELRIVAWDLAGNESTLTAMLTVLRPPSR